MSEGSQGRHTALPKCTCNTSAAISTALMAQNAEQLNEYEQQRLDRIRQNRAKLLALGFSGAPAVGSEVHASQAASSGQQRYVKKRLAPVQVLHGKPGALQQHKAQRSD